MSVVPIQVLASNPDDNASDTMKWCLMGGLFVISFIAGCLPIFVLPLIRRFSHQAAIILSCLSCFSGGVLLGVCLLDIMPDAMDDFDDWKTLSGAELPDFPWMLLGAACGFFLVYLIDGICASLLHPHSHSSTPSNVTLPIAEEGESSEDSIQSIESIRSMKLSNMTKKEYITSLSLLLAISIHVVIEAFALGVQPTTESFLTLFFGISIHKIIVLFSIGMKLYESHFQRPIIVIISMGIIASITFIGGAAGILLDDANLDETAKSLTTALLSCFSAGTFMYITFFEVLGEETGLIIERVMAIIGFIIIGITIYFVG